MKNLIITILLVINPLTDIDKIAKINKLKKEAKEAYLNASYETAIEKYQYLIDSMNVNEETVKLNLANAYYHSKDSVHAMQNYELLTSSQDKEIKSIAHQQLGMLESGKQKYKKALEQFKQALKANPANEDARYNYEMVKKKLKEQEQNQENQQQQQQNNQDQQEQEKQENQKDKNEDQQQDNKNQDKQDGDKGKQDQEKESEGDKGDKKEGEEGEDKKSDEGENGKEPKEENEQKNGKDGKEGENEKERKEGSENENSDKQEQKDNGSAKPMSLEIEIPKYSKEKEEMIFKAMENKEMKYIQQNRRKPAKRPKSDKPDW